MHNLPTLHDESTKPIAEFPKFFDFHEVLGYFQQNRANLTQEQVDKLVSIHDKLKAHPPRKGRDHHEAPRAEAAEDVLISEWKNACAETKSQDERYRRLAHVVARLMGSDSPFRCRRVLDAYTKFGVRPTNRAALELIRESLDIEARFKYLNHRAETHVESAAV